MACSQLSRCSAAWRQSLARGASTFPAGADVVSLPDLPYEYSALEPYISAEIMELHHSKHHQAYVTNYNKALEQWAESESKQDAVSAPKISSALHFNGGGHLNHSIFWKNLCPAKDAQPCSGNLLDAIKRDFGSMQQLQTKLAADAAAVQGSGWGWLVCKRETGRLAIMTSPNQDTVAHVAPGFHPILGIDVWEHAYYLQYKNVRPDYLKAIWNVINWQDAAARYEEAQCQGK
uniref:Superoxide dismutase n=1 Tax=Ulva fasciata TaxID=111617 RepID=D0PNJ1_9CHLO|nr:manganese superoxide dismutase [Ulva fasciata]